MQIGDTIIIGNPLSVPARVCECCYGSYATGKNYGLFWSVLSGSDLEKKGLCEFCNQNNETWYVENLPCHNQTKI